MCIGTRRPENSHLGAFFRQVPSQTEAKTVVPPPIEEHHEELLRPLPVKSKAPSAPKGGLAFVQELYRLIDANLMDRSKVEVYLSNGAIGGQDTTFGVALMVEKLLPTLPPSTSTTASSQMEEEKKEVCISSGKKHSLWEKIDDLSCHIISKGRHGAETVICSEAMKLLFVSTKEMEQLIQDTAATSVTHWKKFLTEESLSHLMRGLAQLMFSQDAEEVLEFVVESESKMGIKIKCIARLGYEINQTSGETNIILVFDVRKGMAPATYPVGPLSVEYSCDDPFWAWEVENLALCHNEDEVFSSAPLTRRRARFAKLEGGEEEGKAEERGNEDEWISAQFTAAAAGSSRGLKRAGGKKSMMRTMENSGRKKRKGAAGAGSSKITTYRNRQQYKAAQAFLNSNSDTAYFNHHQQQPTVSPSSHSNVSDPTSSPATSSSPSCSITYSLSRSTSDSPTRSEETIMAMPSSTMYVDKEANFVLNDEGGEGGGSYVGEGNIMWPTQGGGRGSQAQLPASFSSSSGVDGDGGGKGMKMPMLLPLPLNSFMDQQQQQRQAPAVPQQEQVISSAGSEMSSSCLFPSPVVVPPASISYASLMFPAGKAPFIPPACLFGDCFITSTFADPPIGIPSFVMTSAVTSVATSPTRTPPAAPDEEEGAFINNADANNEVDAVFVEEEEVDRDLWDLVGQCLVENDGLSPLTQEWMMMQEPVVTQKKFVEEEDDRDLWDLVGQCLVENDRLSPLTQE